MNQRVLITEKNPSFAELQLSWTTPELLDTGGLRQMPSLYDAGDALVAVATEHDGGGFSVLGSGVMVGPGLLVTATHVLDALPPAGPGPVFMTFLPGGARAWLPLDIRRLSKESAFVGRANAVSDVSLVSCTLNSEAHVDEPLMLAPMQVALPLIGERLWVFGFQQQAIEDATAHVTPLVSSGLVSAAYPGGRGERMPAPCIEVEMDTVGGMSGGAVLNADGHLVGILSSSFEGGPSYVSLIWDALRLRVEGAIPKPRSSKSISLLGARILGVARLTGDVRRNPWGDVTFRLSHEEFDLLRASAPASAVVERKPAFDAEQEEHFLDEWGAELEATARDSTIATLNQVSLSRATEFLAAFGVPEGCLNGVEDFSVEDFGGVEDLELLATEVLNDGRIRIEVSFEFQSLDWIVTVPSDAYAELEADYRAHFHDLTEDDGFVRMNLFQSCYFRGETTFDREHEFFSDISITSCAIRQRASRQSGSHEGSTQQE